jgi:hypothetical protein
MNVWDYTPDIDKTTFTETSGRKAHVSPSFFRIAARLRVVRQTFRIA